MSRPARMVGIALALGASVAWGGSDFVAGMATRRRSLLLVLAGSQLCGLLVVGALLVAGGQPAPGGGALGLAAAAGVCELTGFAALYAGLARGPMGVVAPVSALGGAVPLAVGATAGDLPHPWAAGGLVLALVGVALASCERERDEGARAAGLALGGAAALAFGLFFTLTGEATDAAGATWAVAINRATSVSVLIVVVLAARRAAATRTTGLRRGDVPAVAAIGGLDAAANALFAFALTQGVRPVVSVLGSLYPITTVALAQLVLNERLSIRQAAGVLATLTGVALAVVA